MLTKDRSKKLYILYTIPYCGWMPPSSAACSSYSYSPHISSSTPTNPLLSCTISVELGETTRLYVLTKEHGTYYYLLSSMLLVESDQLGSHC